MDALLDGVRGGESRALVLHGEPGVGKTALLHYLVERAPKLRTARITGVPSETEFAFAGLHRLCTPLSDGLGTLPAPQREALRAALGLSSGPAPDRFLVGLAVLGLLSEAARERPLICLVDDVQWLDRPSVQALAFAARRLRAESVAPVFAAREPEDMTDLAGLPDMAVTGLPEEDARELLRTSLPGPLDERVLDRFVAETRGNPLALLELPKESTLEQIAGGFGVPDVGALAGRLQEVYRRRLADLPAKTRRLLAERRHR